MKTENQANYVNFNEQKSVFCENRDQNLPGKKKMHFQLWILEMHLQNYKTQKKIVDFANAFSWILQMHFHEFCKCISWILQMDFQFLKMHFHEFCKCISEFCKCISKFCKCISINFANAFSFFENEFALILQIHL